MCFRRLLCGILPACLLLLSTAAISGNEDQQKFPALFAADVVLRGVVTSIGEGAVPVREAEPEHPDATAYMRFKFVDLTVLEVLRGYFDGSDVTIGVNMGRSDIAGNYELGSELIVSVSFNPKLKGGMYVLGAESGRFVKSGSEWQQQGEDPGRLSLDHIRSILASTSVEAVAESSDCVVIGTIAGVRERRLDGPSTTDALGVGSCLVWTVTMKVERVVAGDISNGTIDFDMFRGGSYWPDWASVRPAGVIPGGRRMVFLRKVDGRLVSTAGANGYFGVDAHDVLRRNEQVLPINVERVRTLAQKEQR